MKRLLFRSERGQSLVEMALVIPIAFLLMIGLLDLGRIVFTNNTLSDGARHGARQAAVAPEGCDQIAQAAGTATLGLSLAEFTVTYTTVNDTGVDAATYVLCDNGSPGPDSLPTLARPGDRVTVEIGAALDLATPFVAAATGRETFDLSARSTMQVTYLP